MQIVVPMSGFGERFRRAGYKVPKPLISIEGKPIISHVVDMFPGNNEFIFICNQDHLDNTDMRQILASSCSGNNYQIISIPQHKLGPVYAVTRAFDAIKLDEQVVVNYCDFTCYWNFQDFQTWVNSNQCDGALPAYRGFHPHSLGSTNYAYIREENNKFLEIKEKEPFTSDRMNEYASSGTYYFSKGAYIVKYFQELIDKNISLNGEYYCSLVYNLMHADGLDSQIYELEHFMQWGTPEDVDEYNHWSSIFNTYAEKELKSFTNSRFSKNATSLPHTNLITMAGMGSRFSKEGYKASKPLIQVNNESMFLEAFSSLPSAKKNCFIARKEYASDVTHILEEFEIENSDVITIENPTNGQSCTALLALDYCAHSQPLTISSCDHALLFDQSKLDLLMAEDLDIIVWGFKGYYSAVRYPNMYGWASVKDDNNISKVSVKKALDNPKDDFVITGTFTFKSPEILSQLVNLQYSNDNQVNGEYYLDSTIEEALRLGLKCKIFEVSHYICWGTPNELKTYEYWKTCFSKWNSHSYRNT